MPVAAERRGAVAVLTLSRPEALNAMTADMLRALDARVAEAESDAEVGAVVLTGAGDKAFCAGADIRAMARATPLEARAFAGLGHAVTRRIAASRTPVVAAVNGYALGGGCEVALACDIRLAADTAQLGLPEVTLGILPGWGGTQRLPRLVSGGFAKEMILSGRRVGAAEAAAQGLVNRVVPRKKLMDAALQLAGEIASRPAWAVAAAKELVDLSLDGSAAAGLARELDVFALAFATEDQREGMAAFAERREPRFRGR